MRKQTGEKQGFRVERRRASEDPWEMWGTYPTEDEAKRAELAEREEGCDVLAAFEKASGVASMRAQDTRRVR